MTSIATTPRVTAGTWQADPIHSSVGFEVKHLGVSTFRASFGDYAAALQVDGDGAASLSGTVRADSISVTDHQLRGHLLSPDFFDVERTPEIGFRSTSIELGDDGGIAVEGDLTIKGVTRRVSGRGTIGQPGEDPYGNTRVAIELETLVDRTDFGLGWNMELPGGRVAVANEVRLVISLEAIRQA